MTKDVEVIQGRLGWEVGDISTEKPENLEPHPKNKEIYGENEEIPDSFYESIQEKGVLEPLIIKKDGTIISGHRRWQAATKAELDQVPVRIADFDSDLEEREALIELNRQREKTPGQIVNEYEEMLEIERQKAEERMVEGTPSETFHEGGGRASDKAAERVGANITGRTLEKGRKVKEKAEQGDETAKKEWDKLQNGETSFHTAHKKLEKTEAEKEIEEQESVEQKYEPKVKRGDAIKFLKSVESPDLVIADPPYSTDLDDVESFAQQWIPALLDAIKDKGQAFVFIGAYPDELRAYLDVLHHYMEMNRVQVLGWSYKNTLGQSPNTKYKQNWQAILFIQSKPPTDLDCPKTSEQWAIQEINAPDARNGERWHKWEKPSELIRRLIRHTTEEDDFVVDPFVGTGTTVLEASNLGRRAKGVDNDEEMLEICEERGCIVDGL